MERIRNKLLTANSKQQTANSKQQTANSKQQTANSKQQTANSRQQELDILRIILTFLVVIGHVNYTGLDKNMYEGMSRFLIENQQSILTWIYGFHMPAFMFLSGALFSVNKNFDKFVYDKFKLLVLPTFLLAMLVNIPVKVFTGIYNGTGLLDKYYNIIAGRDDAYDHLWFMMALFWCCIFFYYPYKKLFLKNNLVIGLVIVMLVIKYFPIWFFNENLYLIQTGLSYLFVFAIGYTYNKIKLSEKIKLVYKILYIIIYIFSAIFYYKYEFQGNNIYVVQLTGIMAIYFISELLSSLIKKDKYKKIIISLSKKTRYIYYFHVPLIWISVVYLRDKIIAHITVFWAMIIEVCLSILVSIYLSVLLEFGKNIIKKR